jgi:hypothetical protein
MKPVNVYIIDSNDNKTFIGQKVVRSYDEKISVDLSNFDLDEIKSIVLEDPGSGGEPTILYDGRAHPRTVTFEMEARPWIKHWEV